MPDTTAEVAGLPSLPEPMQSEALRASDDASLEQMGRELDAAERQTVEAMAPFERRLREIRARRSELATERRRRERAQQVTQRAGVREAAKRGDMPTLLAALAASDAPFDDAQLLQAIRAFLSTGGEVGFGFARRPGTLAFTDGRQQRQARTWGEARTLYAEGWEPGSPGIPGVRVHLAGTLVERVTAASDVVLEVTEAG